MVAYLPPECTQYPIQLNPWLDLDLEDLSIFLVANHFRSITCKDSGPFTKGLTVGAHALSPLVRFPLNFCLRSAVTFQLADTFPVSRDCADIDIVLQGSHEE